MTTRRTRRDTVAASRPGRAPVTPASGMLPAWTPVLVYAAVTVVLFREFLLFGTTALGRDSIALSYFARNFYTEFVQTFQRMPHWDPLLFGGLPFVEGMHGDIFYPPSLAMFFVNAATMWGLKMALHVFLAGMFTYLWLHRGLRLDRTPALFGGLVYMMGADLVSLVLPGGDGKLFVSALAPLLFWLTERAVASRRMRDFAIFSLGLALVLFTSHMQAAYYCVWGVSLYFMFRVWQLKRGDALKQIGVFAVAGVLGVGAAAVQFLPPLEYLQEYSHRADRAEQGERGYAWSSTYSLNAEEVVSLVVPEFVGEVAQTSTTRPPAGYWGKNPLKLNSEYAGLVPLLLIPVLLVARRTAQVWFFAGLALLTILHALAGSTPLGRLFYLIPGVSLFRSWSIIIFLYGLAVATLGALGAQQLQDWLIDGRADADIARARRTLRITTGVFAVLALLATSGVLTSAWTAVFYRDIDPGRQAALAANMPYISAGFWIAFVLALCVAGAWELASRRVIPARALLLLLAVLAALDLYRVDRPFLRHTALMNEQIGQTTLLRPDDVIEQLQRLRDDGDPFRVMDLAGPLQMGSIYNQNDFAIHGLEQLTGHHGNEIGRYRALVGGDGADNLLLSELRLANVTNTVYFVAPARLQHPRMQEVYAGGRAVIYRNLDALPRAYVVGSTEIVEGDAAIDRLLSPDFDAATTAILAEPLPTDAAAPQAGARWNITWLERATDSHSLQVTADRPALLVILDNYYPAWRASIDGAAAPIHRANHTFRAVVVPAGTHTVTFRYDAASLRTGALLSLAALAVLLGVIAGGVVSDRRRASAPTTATTA
ncbi:MAG: hypothetical protein WEF86_11380 [Gemmatimonadota bacterium]